MAKSLKLGPFISLFALFEASFHPFFFFFLVLVAQLCPTLCDLMDCSLPGSSIHGILQTRILEWLASPFSRGSSQPRDQTRSPALRADALPSGRLRCKKREEINYTLVRRFELIFSIIPSVPSKNGLLETQLSWVSTLPNHSIYVAESWTWSLWALTVLMYVTDGSHDNFASLEDLWLRKSIPET